MFETHVCTGFVQNDMFVTGKLVTKIFSGVILNSNNNEMYYGSIL